VREILLVLAILAALGMTFRYPFVGILLWTWFTLQNPHRETFGFVDSANVVIAVVTLLALLLSKDRKLPPNGFILWTMIALLAWMTINSFFAFNPEWSWPYWDRTWKTFALGLLIAAATTNRVRIHAVLWVILVSLFYYGVKGGLFTILTGGHNHVIGPPGTMINDNNQLAVALLMTLPIAYYLRNQSTDKRMRIALLAGMILTVVGVIGTYSRGALVGLAALGLLGLLRMKNRLVYLTVGAVLIAFVFQFMPAKYFDRMNTMNSVDSVQTDQSFHGRLVAWEVAYRYANDHFPFGAGFYGPQLAPLYHSYFPNEKNHAAHSIYFQVLGEHGYIGLAIYLMLLAGGFVACSQIMARSRGQPERQWIYELGTAIQASLVVFCVSGAALSLAYYDLFVIDVSLLLPLSETVRALQKRPAWRPVPVAVSG
jgi:putative inorganic carbon (hco3(-)) transporter